MSSTSRRLAFDIVAAWGRHLASAVAGMATIALVSRKLGSEGLGAWALLGTASFFLGLSDLGLGTAIHRAAVTGDAERTRRAVGLALFVTVVLAPLLALGCFPFLVELPGAPEALSAQLPMAALVALAGGVLQALVQPYRAFALIRGGMGPLARARLTGALVQVGTMAALLYRSPSLLAPSMGLVAGGAIELWLVVFAARAIDPDLPLRPVFPASGDELKGALRDGAASLAINLSVVAAVRIDVFLLTRYVPLAMVAAYSIASRGVDQSLVLAKQVSAALLPRVGDARSRERAVVLGTAVYGGLVASGMAALALVGTPVLVAWAGQVAASAVTAHALALLATAAVITSTSELFSTVLTLAGRTAWGAAIPIVIGSSLNLLVSWLGAQAYGEWAIAGGTVLGNAIVALLTWRNARAVLGWSRRRVLGALAPTLAAGAVSLALGLALRPVATGVGTSLAACAAVALAGCATAALLAARALGLTLRPRAASESAPGIEAAR